MTEGMLLPSILKVNRLMFMDELLSGVVYQEKQINYNCVPPLFLSEKTS